MSFLDYIDQCQTFFGKFRLKKGEVITNFKHKTLTVHFNHASYVYSDVNVEDWNAFNSAESQGKALNEFIKGKYEYEKLHEDTKGTLHVAGQKL